ncbi:MAG: DNA repair protein RecO [Candidatus Doudnabacteria bacterium]|nr:DNA repair protein RecO [Candidatus Doudnabacteria bacterium]
MRYRTLTGFVLKRAALREADEVVTFWSWEEGKARVLIRGVKKSTSRLKAALTPVSLVCLQIASSEFMPVVTSARAVKIYSGTLADLPRVAVVFSLFEMVLRSTADNQANVSVSILLRTSLDYLENSLAVDREFLTAFRLRLLSALGYQPVSSTCAQCGRKISAKRPLFWSSIFVGMICGACSRFDASARTLDLPVVSYLDKLKSESFSFSLLAEAEQTKSQAEQLLIEAFQNICERELNSKNFLAASLAS